MKAFNFFDIDELQEAYLKLEQVLLEEREDYAVLKKKSQELESENLKLKDRLLKEELNESQEGWVKNGYGFYSKPVRVTGSIRPPITFDEDG